MLAGFHTIGLQVHDHDAIKVFRGQATGHWGQAAKPTIL